MRKWLDDWADAQAADYSTATVDVLWPALDAAATDWLDDRLTAAGFPPPPPSAPYLAAVPGLADRLVQIYLHGWALAVLGVDAAKIFATGDPIAALEAVWPSVPRLAGPKYLLGAANRVRGLADSEWLRMRSGMADIIARDGGHEDVKNWIETQQNYTEFRADTIARTETQRALVTGEYEGQTADPDGPVEKSWLAANDARTRSTHIDADNQTVPMAEPFQVGGVSMMHPHDSGAPAREVVNCRCTVLYHYRGDSRPDGTIIE